MPPLYSGLSKMDWISFGTVRFDDDFGRSPALQTGETADNVRTAKMKERRDVMKYWPQSVLTRRADARNLPDHAAAPRAARPSGRGCTVEVAARVEHWRPIRSHAVTTAEVMKVDQVAALAAIAQLED